MLMICSMLQQKTSAPAPVPEITQPESPSQQQHSLPKRPRGGDTVNPDSENPNGDKHSETGETQVMDLEKNHLPDPDNPTPAGGQH